MQESWDATDPILWSAAAPTNPFKLRFLSGIQGKRACRTGHTPVKGDPDYM